jgi:hypothetical protein
VGRSVYSLRLEGAPGSVTEEHVTDP